MSASPQVPVGTHLLSVADLQRLLDILTLNGRTVIGPTWNDGSIIYDQVRHVDDLPRGWGDEQAPGKYRTFRRNDQQLFGFAVGPHSWRRYLHPPVQGLVQGQKSGKSIQWQEVREPATAFAFLGVRACEIAAIERQADVFAKAITGSNRYAERRAQSLIIAVNCAEPAATCFCDAMHTGPEVHGGADLVLTECINGDQHFFLVRAESSSGQELLQTLTLSTPTPENQKTGANVLTTTKGKLRRQFPGGGEPSLAPFLEANIRHSEWDKVAERCLSCGNCTNVCPTCFCTTTKEVIDLSGASVERQMHWDNCFTNGFSHVHGGPVRDSTAARYRQWVTHKLGTWWEQFGSSGCVGCGRCATWCPVGIDFIDEITKMQQTDPRGESI